MRSTRRLSALAVFGLAAACGLHVVWAGTVVKNTASDRPLILDQDTDYVLRNVVIAGLRDSAAVTLAGRIKSVFFDRSSFGSIRAGENGTAAGLQCAGATVGTLTAIGTTFFDCENQLLSLREGSFGVVTFRDCAFKSSESFLKEMYEANPWRTWPPVVEFYNIDRLELFDNSFSNTIVIIHPSVRKVVIRGEIPGLELEDPSSTQVIRLDADDEPAGPAVAQAR